MNDLENALELGRQLIRINTVKGDPDYNLLELAGLLQTRLESSGFITTLRDRDGEDANLYAVYGDGPVSLLYVCHMDTVAFDESHWGSIKPLGGEVIDNKLWGRGSCDVKGQTGGLVVAVEGIL